MDECDKIETKNIFAGNVERSSKKLQKLITADLKTNISNKK